MSEREAVNGMEENEDKKRGGRDLHVEVRTPHGHYPPQVREDVSSKLVELTRFFKGTHSIRAILDHHQNRHRIELLASTGGRTTLAVDATSTNFAKALHESVHRMQRALRKHKVRITKVRRRH